MTLMRVLIKDALTRHRTALPRVFSHINRRAFRVFSDDVSEDDNKVSEDQIRLHFRKSIAKGNADPNISDVYDIVDPLLLGVGIRGTQYRWKNGAFTDQTSCAEEKGLQGSQQEVSVGSSNRRWHI